MCSAPPQSVMSGKPLMSTFFTLLLVLQLPLPPPSSVAASSTFLCKDSESQALLQFKSGLKDPFGRLSSWIHGEDCCKWRGVVCNNDTGHVIQLKLQNNIDRDPGKPLQGKLNPSLVGLEHLQYLDLSGNDFSGSTIPTFLGDLEELRHLNLSRAKFGGHVPPHLGNLSKLAYLDLFSHYTSNLVATEVTWLSQMASLIYLDMSLIAFPKGNDWLVALHKLPYISTIHLQDCGIDSIPQSLPHQNFTLLSTFDIRFNDINSNVPQWLCNISTMQYLRLSYNQFNSTIPNCLCNISTMQHLDLHSNELNSAIPQCLCNISTMRHLDLSGNQFNSTIPNCLCNIRTMQHLDLSSNELNSAIPQCLCNISNIQHLYLSGNQLSSTIPKCLFDKSSLHTLDLSNNKLLNVSVIAKAIGSMKWIKTLWLEHLNLHGDIRDFTHSLCNIEMLYLTDNEISGNLFDAFSHCGGIDHLQKLETFHISHNQLTGKIPKIIWKLKSLSSLDLGSNSFVGIISPSDWLGYSGLHMLDLSSNSLKLDFPSNWKPPFNLHELDLGHCEIGPSFPSWIQTQVGLSILNLSSSGISDTLPQWIWYFSSEIEVIDISNNNLFGIVPNLINVYTLWHVDLHSNNLNGSLPQMHNTTNLAIMVLTDNKFVGPIHLVTMPQLEVLSISSNHIRTELPTSICDIKSLKILDVSRNNFFGVLPLCLGDLNNLESLHLNNNNFTGSLFTSLQNCVNLSILDAGENTFTGYIPSWIVGRMSMLRILRIRSNMFSGQIPLNISCLCFLQVLDLANNNFSGLIPPTIGNFNAMKQLHLNSDTFVTSSLNHYQEKISIVFRGYEMYYDRLLVLVNSLDISENGLVGELPQEIGDLLGLQNLNLSGNHLIGALPNSLYQLQLLESLDLSRNNFSGSIPYSISKLASLSHLNLSYNNLSGEIPSSTQFDTFPNSSFVGNPNLCGYPLKSCNGGQQHEGPNTKNQQHLQGEYDIINTCLGMSFGFVVGFWLVWGTLIIKKKWSYYY